MALLTVGAGQTYSTITAAIAAATSVDSIVLRSDITESVTINKNFLELYSDNGSIWTSAAPAIITVTNGLTQQVTVRDLIIRKSTGNNDTIIISSLGVGGKVYFLRVQFFGLRTSGAPKDMILINASLIETNQIVVERCMLSGGGKTGNLINIQNATATANAVLVQNCILESSGSKSVGIELAINTTTSTLKCYNNTFYSLLIGLETNGTSRVENCLFIGNTDDVNILNSAAKTDFLNCAFEQQTNDGGWDATIIFGITTATEVIDASIEDFRLLDGASSIQAGRTISESVDDYVGRSWPHSVNYDIGAYLYRRKISAIT